MLLVQHKKLDKWLPPGGHMDEGELPHECALREVKEEIGIEVTLINDKFLEPFASATEEEIPAPICIFHETIEQYKDKPKHKHIDFIYLMEADEQTVTPLFAEITDAKWLTLEEILTYNTFPSLKAFAKKIIRT